MLQTRIRIDFFGYYIGEYFDWEGMDRYELKPVLTQVVKEPESSTAVFTTLQVKKVHISSSTLKMGLGCIQLRVSCE